MVSLVMVVFDELVDELAYMSLAKRDHATETLLFGPQWTGQNRPFVDTAMLRWPRRSSTSRKLTPKR